MAYFQGLALEAIARQQHDDSAPEGARRKPGSWYKIEGDRLKFLLEVPARDEELDPSEPDDDDADDEGMTAPVWFSIPYVKHTGFEFLAMTATDVHVHVPSPEGEPMRFQVKDKYLGFLVPEKNGDANRFSGQVPPEDEQREASAEWLRVLQDYDPSTIKGGGSEEPSSDEPEVA